MRVKKPLSWRGKLLMAVLSPVVVLGLLELGLRIGGFRFEPWRVDLEVRSYSELRQIEIYQPDPELLWTLRPSSLLDERELGFPLLLTNAHGLRGGEIPGAKVPGEVRVLCLGDSVTFGLGLLDGDTWPERMAEALRESPDLAGRMVRVVNGAVPGWSSVQGLRLLERLDTLEPDVVVFWFGINDAYPMRGVPDSWHGAPVEGARSVLSILSDLRVVQLLQRAVSSVRETPAEGTRVSRAEFRENVERLRELERSGGPRVLFVHEPECMDVTLSQLERLVARAEEEGVEVILGPGTLLGWIEPAPDGADFTGSRLSDGSAIRFQEDLPADVRMAVAELRADIDRLREHKEAFDRLLEGLPESKLTYADLFGETPRVEVFIDNCHLMPLGAELAGAALAEAVLRVMREEDRESLER